MKKILSTVAALGLVAGVATTASALDFSVSGNYTVEGYYLSDGGSSGMLLQEAAGIDNAPDAYWMHTFAIRPTMKVNDNITMNADIRLATDTVWGNQANGDLSTSPTNDSAAAAHGDVYVHRLYMDYMSPIGKIRVGRTPAGPYGTPFLDTDTRGDRVMWWPSFVPQPFNLLVYTAKVTEADSLAGTADQDRDQYDIWFGYKQDNIDAGVRYELDRQRGNSNPSTTGYTTDIDMLEAYGVFNFSNMFLATEIAHLGGSAADYYLAAAGTDQDIDAWAGLVQFGAKFGDFSGSVAYVYASGDDDAAATTDREDALALAGGAGSQFTPLYILTGKHMGLLTQDQFTGITVDNQGYGIAQAGVHCLALFGDYQVSDRLSLHGAIAYAQADEAVQATAGVATPPSYLGRDDEYGWEYDLGAAYKLLDNLTYEAHFGYLDTGDFFNSSATANDAENVYLLSHSLTMTF